MQTCAGTSYRTEQITERAIAGGFRIQKISPDEFGEVEALFNSIYPWKPVPDGFGLWRYASADPQDVCLGVRTQSGLLVAAYGLEFFRAVNHSEHLSAGLVTDVIVRADYQRQGIGAHIGESVFDYALGTGCAFLYCFPNPRLASLHDKLGAWVTETHARAFVRSAPLQLPYGPSWQPAFSDRAPDGVERLWRDIRQHGSLKQGFERNERFLSWRFTRHPRNRYEFIWYCSGSELQGIAVVKVWTNPFTQERTGDIVDLLAPDEATSIDLLVHACRRLDDQSVFQYNVWAPPSLSEDAMEYLGFQPDPSQRRPVQVRYARHQLRGCMKGWFYTQADTDIY